MAISYLSSLISVGNSNFDALASDTVSVWGSTYVESGRFILVLVRTSAGDLAWAKVDPLLVNTETYDMPYAPEIAGIGAGDRGATVQGQFLDADDTYLYYLAGNTLLRRSYATGGDAGSMVLRNNVGAALVGANINAFALSSAYLYVASKADQRLYAFNLGAMAWDGATINAIAQYDETELINSEIAGLAIQPDSEDPLLVLRGTAKQVVKYSTNLSVRKGVSIWTDPGDEVVATEFQGTILHMTSSDNLTAGSGVLIYRFGDASTDVIAKENTYLTVQRDRVRAGSDEVIKVTYRARDGYGQKFQPTEKVRFSIQQVGDSFDKDDGALSLYPTPSGFRNSKGEPVNTTLDVPFNADGEAICYWHTPLTVPADILLHRIRVEYPIV